MDDERIRKSKRQRKEDPEYDYTANKTIKESLSSDKAIHHSKTTSSSSSTVTKTSKTSTSLDIDVEIVNVVKPGPSKAGPSHTAESELVDEVFEEEGEKQDNSLFEDSYTSACSGSKEHILSETEIELEGLSDTQESGDEAPPKEPDFIKSPDPSTLQTDWQLKYLNTSGASDHSQYSHMPLPRTPPPKTPTPPQKTPFPPPRTRTPPPKTPTPHLEHLHLHQQWRRLAMQLL